MLLYTIMPIEAVFPPEGERKVETQKIRGGFVEVMETPQGKTVSRLISTDPRLYLSGPKPGDKYTGGS